MMELVKNEFYNVKITGYTSEGLGVARIDGKVVFIPGTIVGEECRIKIIKSGKNVNYAIVDTILDPSSERTIPECPYFKKCGGCSLMHMSYAEELRFKKEKVENDFKHIGKIDIDIDEIIGASEQYRYRNKAIFNISDCKDGIKCGFYRQHSHDVTDIDDCLISSLEFSSIVKATIQWMKDNGIKAYDGKKGIRHIFLRQGHNTKEIQVCLVAAGKKPSSLDKLIEVLTSVSSNIKSVVLNINNDTGNTVLKGKFITIWGNEKIQDEMCGLRFAFAQQSFYQINTEQAEKLYMRAIDYAQIDKNTKVLDLYCGIGTISLVAAQHAECVIGVEIVQAAIDNANSNATSNEINNAKFICADSEEAVDYIQNQLFYPDVVIVDPPRKGLTQKTILSIIKMNPKRVVYVSCNPATLARDMELFNNNGYLTRKATVVDMFPRTYHVETVCLMTRK